MFYLECGSVREDLQPIALLSVQIELPNKLVASRPGIRSFAMTIIFVECALVKLSKTIDNLQ